MVEMLYHLQLSSSQGSEIVFIGLTLNTTGFNHWALAALVMGTGLALFELARRRFAREWGEIQAFIEKKLNREEAS